MLIVTVFLIGGCGAAPHGSLCAMSDVADLAVLAARAEALPRRTTLVPTVIGDGPAVGVALHEIGDDTSDRKYVLIHGVKTDHRCWRFVVGAIGGEHDLVLVDLPGCGDSDRPLPHTLGPRGYSPDALAERVLQTLDAYLARREGETRVTLVGHSLGGAIALRMAGSTDLRRRYRHVLRYVDRIVLMAPADVEIVSLSPELVALANVSGLEIAVADFLGILQHKVAEATRAAVVEPDRALRVEADRTCDTLLNRDTRLALQAMLLQAVPRRPDGELNWEEIDARNAEYTNVDVPCLVMWGRYDETLGKAMGYKIAAQVPGAELFIVPDCKHSMQIERPILCAETLVRFTALGKAWNYSGGDSMVRDDQDHRGGRVPCRPARLRSVPLRSPLVQRIERIPGRDR
jgi:pimeloyl-ACP methyl ester carboxylesterase